MRRLFHYAPHLLYVALLISAVSAWFPRGDWLWALVAFMVVAVTGTVLDMRYHRGRLCELCAANVPLNGGLLAERYRAPFRAVHWMTDRVWRLFAGIVVVNVLILPLPLPLASTVLFAALGVLAWVGDQHVRLRPWCPFCQWGGGGDEETTPVAPPTPSTSR